MTVTVTRPTAEISYDDGVTRCTTGTSTYRHKCTIIGKICSDYVVDTIVLSKDFNTATMNTSSLEWMKNDQYCFYYCLYFFFLVFSLIDQSTQQ
ncbi:hypothetical protein DFA_04441 [Cavenderia fasciculata]|uniref:Uncharacterized protein n=1 Tax=Cavenderia fasciculata TaxID=261658 RepID=F4PPL0_CACFS|nr:uncharacterized protein DFA_04441 [Cavenderia fasciculata]EGG22323.1 hypothetical protein DFA_04441 [Cavenderia fasciculata]|eukprot:XP_004360174.1 hypothetical protein DFA_04441 [Cavenderia fasciculata]